MNSAKPLNGAVYTASKIVTERPSYDIIWKLIS